MASFLSTLFGGGAEKENAEKNRQEYANYLSAGTGFLNSGLTNSQGALNNAKADFAPLSDLGKKYGAGTSLFLDALGVNGADGNARAASAFTNNPGFESGLSAGLDAINRRRAAAGMLASGNADQDAQTFGQNLQNQQFGSWLSNLGGLVTPELSATSGAATGMAGTDTNLANLYQQDAQNRIGLQGNFTSGNVNANNLQAAGEAKGASNLLGLGTSLLSLGTGGGNTIGGNIVKGLFG